MTLFFEYEILLSHSTAWCTTTDLFETIVLIFFTVHAMMLPYERKSFSNKKCNVSIRTMCNVKKLQQVFEVLSFGLDIGPQSFCHSSTGRKTTLKTLVVTFDTAHCSDRDIFCLKDLTFPFMRCSKSAQKFAVSVVSRFFLRHGIIIAVTKIK